MNPGAERSAPGFLLREINLRCVGRDDLGALLSQPIESVL